MTWQESLRQLDARLARGEIGAAEYRKSRDEILAEASSGSVARQPEDMWAPAKPAAEPPAPAEPAEPAGDAASAETTLVVKVDSNDTTDETTQVVDANTITPQPAQPAQPAPQGPPPGAPWAQQTAHRPAPPIQGQEVFAEAAPARGRLLVRVLVPIVVLALIGASVWWFVFREDGEPAPAAQPPATTSEQAPRTTTDDIAARLPELPGNASQDNGTMTVQDALGLKLFTEPYTTLLVDNGAEDVVYRGSGADGIGYLLAASPIPPANGAEGVAVLTREHLQRAGFAPAEEVTAGDPPVISRTDAALRTFIAIYSSGDVWIQFNASAKPDADPEALRAAFQKVLAELTERLPAD
ncbi:SHOCT domain-containing protein [Actinophytocola sp. S1-96]|uniref:SHOCT domain-containing protein n=2 Tax=Actinophytocola gossypii TaxID=2812003 RepID=A0ABT2JH29_9PSEU|nr:SHOCT domain-containing protein [Actinophytocola gossypii]